MEEKKPLQIFENEDRTKLYAEADKVNYPESVSPPAEEKVKEPEQKSEQPPVETEKKVLEPEPKKEEVAEVKKEEPKKEDKKEKFVPYDALHAERMKRKAETDRAKAAEDRAKALEETLAKIKQTEPEPEFITDSDRKLYEMEVKLKAIEMLEQNRHQREAEQKQRDLMGQLTTNIDRTDKDLSEEGYPGFGEAIGSVQKKLQQMATEIGEEDALLLDNPAGWKKIYKEEIYPVMFEKFKTAIQKQSVDGKIELKKQAGLVSSPGKAEPKPKSDDDKSEDEIRADYLAMRKAAIRY